MALAKSDVLAPMQRVAGQGFVGREKELAQLQQYVFGPKARCAASTYIRLRRCGQIDSS